MTTSMSKRNQARNEKALQELLRNVPGNDRCADCQARNPGWASWSLGVFLCMRCAALHRKLGTHISKVKSLSMDSWTNDQVEQMQKMGNVKSNKIWNPQNKQPAVPIDVDEVDGAVEKFIRQKYEQKAFSGGRVPTSQTASQASYVSSPTSISRPRSPAHAREPSPPPPQKSSRKFGFGLRSATSTFNLGKPKGRERKSSLPTGKVVGATIGLKEDELGWKLVTLKEMGFSDERRNTEILKGLNGDLERTVESLVRLGQGPSGSSGVKVRKQASPSFEQDSDRFPAPGERSSSRPAPSGNAITGAGLVQTPEATGYSGVNSPVSASGSRKQSNNPFDQIQAQPQPTPQASFEQAFGNMSLSQPLSSQSTGILPSQQPNQQHVIYQQSMTPPPTGSIQASVYNPYMQQMMQQQQPHQVIYSDQQLHLQAQSQALPMQPQYMGANPFLQNQWQQQQAVQQAAAAIPTSNPFYQQQQQLPQQQIVPQITGNPYLQQGNASVFANNNESIAMQQGQYMQQGATTLAGSPGAFQGVGLQQQQHANLSYNPYHEQMQQQPLQQQGLATSMSTPSLYNQYGQAQMQPIMPQPTGRLNKQNIMALYNTPQLTPQPSIPENQAVSSPPPLGQLSPNAKAVPVAGIGNVTGVGSNNNNNRRSVTMPIMGSAPMATSNNLNNPYGQPVAMAPSQTAASPVMSNRDSIFMDSGSDPFASLSARFVR